MAMPRGRGLTLAGVPLAELGALARQAESSGFGTLWVAETARSAVVQATIVAAATHEACVGTNIMLAFPRSPATAAREAWDLQVLASGRFLLGLGSQVRRIVEDHYSSVFDQPARRMAEYVEAVRAVWSMEQGRVARFEGELYRIVRPGAHGLGSDSHIDAPGVLVAGVGPLMTAVAATHGDGILGHAFTSRRYVRERLLPRVAKAAATAGRSRLDVAVCQGIIVSINDDRSKAVRAAKRQIGFYGTTPNYHEVFESCGDEYMLGLLRRTWQQTNGNPAALEDVVPDEMVDRYAVVGRPDEVGARIKEWEELVDHVIVNLPWYGMQPAERLEILLATVEALATP